METTSVFNTLKCNFKNLCIVSTYLRKYRPNDLVYGHNFGVDFEKYNNFVHGLIYFLRQSALIFEFGTNNSANFGAV
jgi:hypothetical protein